MGDDVLDVQRVDEQRRALVEFFLTTAGFFFVGEDVDFQTGQHRGKADVLPATADGQRQLIIRHYDFDPPSFLVEDDLGHLGGCQRVDHVGRDVLRPRNNVDLLALQLADNGLHAAAAHTDTGADRVDVGFVADHRDFCAGAGVAGDRLDLDQAVVDLRHLHGE